MTSLLITSDGWRNVQVRCRHPRCKRGGVFTCVHTGHDPDRLKCLHCGRRTAAVTHYLAKGDVWKRRLELVSRA